ncbi:hypothetical protein ALC60_11072 [Trachymyrmex zeteki]|uniref:Uncharacterized protein n=1 Tax=Mycetomoellerius zeteki TaxID=64791 RepID=A0A151WQ10_9HYME|nr:hypothetical protein ALC60_11072 [Trachymyrmex zeteki]
MIDTPGNLESLHNAWRHSHWDFRFREECIVVSRSGESASGVDEFQTCQFCQEPRPRWSKHVREFSCGMLYYRTLYLDSKRDALYVGAICDDCGITETNFNVDDNAVTEHTEIGDAKTSKHDVIVHSTPPGVSLGRS